MIIRPACENNFTSLPNVIFTDRQLAADTRAMLALLLSKPKNWEVRPRSLATDLSTEGARPLGKKRLRRMFNEAMRAGYMARSEKQSRHDGDWGPYIYFVGLPTDVVEAVKKSGVVILPQVPEAPTRHAAAPDGPTYKGNTLPNIESTKPPLTPRRKAAPQQGCASEGRAAPRRSLRPVMIRRSKGPEVLQASIAKRLGPGGFEILMNITSKELDELTARERTGTLTDELLADLRFRFSATTRVSHG